MKRIFTSSIYSVVLIFSMLFTTTNLHAQDLDETLSNLSSTAGKAYAAPVVNAFGSNLNSGWVNRVPTKLVGFNFDLKVVGVGTFLDDADQRFSTTGNFRFSSSQANEILSNSGINPGDPGYTNVKNEILSREWSVQMQGPTITGKEAENFSVTFPGQVIEGENVGRYTVEIPDVKGFLNELSVFPSAALQLTVGTVLGTRVAVRYFPEVDVKDMGKFSWTGFGVIHNPSTWLANPLPVDIAFGYFTQKLEVGDIFESNATQFGIYVSKTFGLGVKFIPYASFTTESSDTKIKYQYKFDSPAGEQTTDINFELEGENKTAVTLGVALDLPVITLNVDYKIAKVKTMSGGISFGF